jgi:hypothetical protein
MHKEKLRHQAMNQDKVLKAFNTMFLKMSGYSPKEVRNLGDPSKLTSKEMQKLLHKKTLEAVVQAAKGTEIKPFSKRVHRDSSST